jgi:ubiquitin conjugation factor E4 B
LGDPGLSSQPLQELNQDAGGTFNYKLTKDLLDRVIVSRLIESPPEQYPQLPFHYLLGCYARSSQELRSISVALPDEVRQKLQESIFAARDLVISYTGLVFMGGLVPEVGLTSHADTQAAMS